MNVTVNSHGVNTAIKANILDDSKMRAIGFTDYNELDWYYYKMLNEDISFNVTIPKDGSEISIDVLDEDFCQPYDYQALLEHNSSNEFAAEVKDLVEEQMQLLKDKGIIEGHIRGEYI